MWGPEVERTQDPQRLIACCSDAAYVAAGSIQKIMSLSSGDRNGEHPVRGCNDMVTRLKQRFHVSENGLCLGWTVPLDSTDTRNMAIVCWNSKDGGHAVAAISAPVATPSLQAKLPRPSRLHVGLQGKLPVQLGL